MLSRSAVRYFAWFVLAPVAFPASSLAGGVATHHHRGTPTIDGVEDPLEWSGAEAGVAPLTLPPELGGGLGFVTFLIMSDDENLYAAIRFPYAVSPPSPGFAALVIFAWPSGDDICAPPTTPDQFQILSQDGGANYSDSFATSFCAADGPPRHRGRGYQRGFWNVHRRGADIVLRGCSPARHRRRSSRPERCGSGDDLRRGPHRRLRSFRLRHASRHLSPGSPRSEQRDSLRRLRGRGLLGVVQLHALSRSALVRPPRRTGTPRPGGACSDRPAGA